MKRWDLFINNAWRPAASGKTFSVLNPATEEVLAEVAEGDAADVDLAARAARAAFESGPWPAMTPSERGRLLLKLARAVEDRLDELARLETLNSGKPIRDSREGDIPGCVELLEYYAGAATKIVGEVVPVSGPYLNYVLREPVGVVGAIIPWNFPLYLAVQKLAPALAAGNTIVIKPAEQTPLTALRFAELCQEAGVPPGVVNVVPGLGPTAGAALVEHPAVDLITFTGEYVTGQEIMRRAAPTLKRLVFELGGKSPNIVFADADLERATRGAFKACFDNQGEVCCAGSRLFVEAPARETLLDRLVAMARELRPGDPLKEDTRLGALISREHLDKVTRYVDVGRREGARLAAGGDRPAQPPARGFFFNPTVFDGVENRMTIARDEIFGPVLAVIPFRDVEDVVAQANDTSYGLAAGLWTRDIGKAHALARRLRAGTVWINTWGAFDVASPFGGVKASGFGREGGMAALEHYTERKSVWVRLP